MKISVRAAPKDRIAQGLGALAVALLTLVTAVEAGEQASLMAQAGVVLKYLGFAVCIAWPLLKGYTRRQTLDTRVVIGLSLVLGGMALHWGVRLGYF